MTAHALNGVRLGWLFLCVFPPSVWAQYSHPFGDSPFLPSRALTASDRFIQPDAFPTAAYCGKCHHSVHEQWRQSAHSNSFREPFYIKNVELLIQEKGIEYTRHCEGCHNPIALFSGALTPGSKVDRSSNADGVTCMVCHSITQIQDVGGTGSYVMGRPVVMVKEDGAPVEGVVADAEILRRPDLHRKAVMRDFYRSAEFCAVCHQAEIPKQLNGYRTLRPFSVYSEWQDSAWAGQSPLPFYKKDKVSTCQTCHMPDADAPGEPAAVNGKAPSHRWLGANTAIPAYYGYTDQKQMTEEFLKKAVSIDIFALKTNSSSGQSMIAPLNRQRVALPVPGPVTVEVVVMNNQIGHSLVPEQRDFYEAWVEFQAIDAAGKSVFRSGFLERDGVLEKRAHSYTNRLLSSDGKLLDRHQIWDFRVRAYDNTINPGKADLVRYEFEIPARFHGPLTLIAKVNYRRFRRSYSDWVLGQPLELPVVTMAQQTVVIGGDPARQDLDPAGDALRWNNYGIALLEQQEYARACEAFGQVVRMQPGYADGYINVAVAELSQGDYNAALESLRTALALDTNSDRARAYQGLVYRLQYNLDAAIEALKPIVAAYPRLRMARQELAYAYFLKKQYEPAREQYEAFQSIDPNDLGAYRYLAALYEKLKLPQKSAQQAAALADRQDDPASAYLVQRYWILDPPVAYEVSRVHVHGNDQQGERSSLKNLLRTSAIWPY